VDLRETNAGPARTSEVVLSRSPDAGIKLATNLVSDGG
jgi:hypothetical protein